MKLGVFEWGGIVNDVRTRIQREKETIYIPKFIKLNMLNSRQV